MSNQPDFDPLHPTPEEADDMFHGYCEGGGVGRPDASLAGGVKWQDRIDNMIRETGFPRNTFVMNEGGVIGMWTMGNNYRVKSGYHGGYPNTYLRRVRALFPDKKCVLHVFSGRVDLETMPGDTVDLNSDLSPTFVDDCQTMLSVPLERYDLILADPPYSGEDADRYGTTMVKRNLVVRALSRVQPGTHLVWLDMVLPMYRKSEWKLEADIGMRRSTNHRFRSVTIFERTAS